MAWLVLSERVPEPGAPARPTGDLQSVFVLPDFRAQGIGRRLIEAVINTASALGLEYLSVRAGTRSRPLYQRLGFTTNGHVLELGLPDRERPRTS
ncbi:GNAT family N-acetyltransferase [Spirillospora sp. CA-255316]